jgi:hypothetical protein
VSNSFTAHLNREGQQSVSAPETFETEEGFTVYLRNHGTPLHVHVRLGDSLGTVAEVVDPNRYVEEGSTRRVRIDVDNADRPIEGQIQVVTGYGSETESITVTVGDTGAVETKVPVDEELSRPAPSTGLSGGGSSERLRNAALGGAILLVIAVAVVIGEPLVIVGGLLILAGVVVAGYLLSE